VAGATQKKASGSRETEKAFIDAATVLFAEKGYNGTSIQDLADRLGLTTASLYYYVDGKRDLLFRVLQSGVESFLAGLEEIVAEDIPAREKLRRAISSHIGFVLDKPSAVAVFLRERRFLPPEQRDEYAARVDRYDRMFTEIVKKAMDDGDVPGGDPMLLRVLGLGSINWIVEWYRPDGRLTRDELHQQLLNTVLGRMFGLSAQDPSASVD
jgi:AcrR family transcriptional regulator